MNTSQETAIKIAIGQINITAGNPQANLQKILNYIQQARGEEADIVVFPEMAIPGYLLSDLWEDDAFVAECSRLSEQIQKASRGVTVVFGNVLADNRPSIFDPTRQSFGNDGRLRKFNAAYVYSDCKAARRFRPFPQAKKILRLAQNDNERIKILPDGVTIKTLQPLYREFEDQRHFISTTQYSSELNMGLEDLLQPFKVTIWGGRSPRSPNRVWLPRDDKNNSLNVGVVVCEDIWIRDYIYHGQICNPAKILVENGAEIIIAISASPFGWRKFDTRVKAINRVQKSLFDIGKPTPLVNVNCVGFQNNGKNEFGFDGRSTVHDAYGDLLFEAPAWEEGLYTTTVTVDNPVTKQSRKEDRHASLAMTSKFADFTSHPHKQTERKELHDALVQGLKEFARQKGIENFVVGLSGGIDSALVAYLCVQAMGKEHVLAINMPSKFNSDRTKTTAATIAKNLGISYQIVPIEEATNNLRSIIADVNFNGDSGSYSTLTRDNLVDENLQAKIRSVDILSNIAAKYPKTVYTCNGNKTEIALGYFTLDGDGRGAICPLGDVFKTDIANLAVDINLGVYSSSVSEKSASKDSKKFTLSSNNKANPLFPWELIAPIFVPETYFETPEDITDILPLSIKAIVPSAELSDNQNVEKGRGDPIIFAYHDRLLRQFIEYRQNPEHILLAYDLGEIPTLASKLELSPELLRNIFQERFPNTETWIGDLETVWRLFSLSTYKQIQSPPIISVSKRSFGYDFRRSQLPCHFTRHYLQLKETILEKANNCQNHTTLLNFSRHE